MIQSVVTTDSRGIFMSSIKSDLTIGKLSEFSGVNIETIRYYEKIGIIPKPSRSQSGYRLYNEEYIKNLTFVKRSRELGFSIKEIKSILTLVKDHSYSCSEVHGLTISHLNDTRKKIKDLKKLESTLKEMAAQCEGGLIPECPIIDELYSSYTPIT